MTGLSTVAILMPMRNDWSSCQQLCAALDEELAQVDVIVDVHVVDDYTLPARAPLIQTEHIQSVYCTRLVRNLGHQRAIAAGLVTLYEMYHYDAIIVMDSDGEDCPADVVRLLELAADHLDSIIVARRERRSEGVLFKAFYRVYKRVFALFTGYSIDFGNFCLIPQQYVKPLVYHPGLWNHLAATLVDSRIPVRRLPTHRCRRYAGTSSMNFTALVVHGMSAISVFLSDLAVRMLLISFFVIMLTLCGMVAVVVIRLFTSLAIPGWATTATGILLIVLGQTMLMTLLITFWVLQQRSAVQIIPANDISYLIDRHYLLSESNDANPSDSA